MLEIKKMSKMSISAHVKILAKKELTRLTVEDIDDIVEKWKYKELVYVLESISVYERKIPNSLNIALRMSNDQTSEIRKVRQIDHPRVGGTLGNHE